MRLLHLPLISLAVLTPAAPLFAEAADGGFSVRGTGAQTCGVLTEAVEKDSTGATLEYLAAWVAGYTTHANRVTDGVYEAMPITDNRVLARVVLALCRANPQSLTETLVASLIASLGDAAAPAATDVVEITNGGQSVQLPRSTFVLVQKRLVAAGRLPDQPGAVDGRYGPQSRDALLAHQQSAGLAETGLPDPATLLSLFARTP